MNLRSIVSRLIYNLVVFSPFCVLSALYDSAFGYCVYFALVLTHFRQLFHKGYGFNIDYKPKNNDRVCVYLLNLDRATERLQHVFPLMQQLNFTTEKISAVDGNNLSDDYIASITDEYTYVNIFKMLPEHGTIGCSLSHLKAWLKFLESNDEFALICEDDITFEPQKLNDVIHALIQYKTSWDLVTFEVLHNGYPVNIQQIAGYRVVLYLGNITHSGCYIINRPTAYKLIQKFYPIKVPIDHYFTASWEFGIKLFGVEPRIVKQSNTGSQIKMGQAKKIKSKKMQIRSLRLQIKRAIFLFIYNPVLFIEIELRRNWVRFINRD